MNDNENLYLNNDQSPAQPAPAAEPAAEQIASQPAPAWEKPVPQLTLDPDPVTPPIDFSSPEPPRAPEPPTQDTIAPEQGAQEHTASGQAPGQPQVQNQYVYNFNTVPTGEQGYQQNGNPGQNVQGPGGQYQYNPPGYQPPNYTAQSYQPQPQQQPKYTTPPVGYQQKSRLAAGLLAILLGSLGVHNFYMGYNTRGTIQLVLCLAGGLITCGLGSIAALVWGFIEGVMLLSSNNVRFDGNGVIMKD